MWRIDKLSKLIKLIKYDMVLIYSIKISSQYSNQSVSCVDILNIKKNIYIFRLLRFVLRNILQFYRLKLIIEFRIFFFWIGIVEKCEMPLKYQFQLSQVNIVLAPKDDIDRNFVLVRKSSNLMRFTRSSIKSVDFVYLFISLFRCRKLSIYFWSLSTET